MKLQNLRNCTGLTLIELMITVGVIALLASIAIPAYDNQQRKGRRIHAIDALTKIQTELQRCYSRFGGYDCCNTPDDLTEEDVLGKVLPDNPLTDNGGYYTITFTTPVLENNQAPCKQAQDYVLTATPTADTDQENDSCTTFTFDAIGNRTATTASCLSDL